MSHYVGLREEPESSGHQISYVAAPSYPASATYTFPSEITAAAPEAQPAVPTDEERQARCRRFRSLRGPMWLTLFALGLLIAGIVTPHWYDLTRVAQATPFASNPVVTTHLQVGLYRSHGSTTTFDATGEGEPVTEHVHLNCKALQGRSMHDCFALRHKIAPLLISSASVAFVVLLLIIIDRCGKFGSTRKVWIAPAFQLAVVVLTCVALHNACRTLRGQRHGEDTFASSFAPVDSADSPVTVYSTTANWGFSFFAVSVALIFQLLTLLGLLGHACRSRCTGNRQHGHCRRWRAWCGRAPAVQPLHS